MSVPIAKKPRNRLGEKLRRRGFDKTSYNRSEGTYRVGCSQCAALVLNGLACHETGCPNMRKATHEE